MHLYAFMVVFNDQLVELYQVMECYDDSIATRL
jgi:hypothetical protein